MIINSNFDLDDFFHNLNKNGAFLIAKDKNDKLNVMSIGWGNIGIEWEKPVFSILVRKSRYTHEILENAKDFSVCIPIDDSMKKQIGFCGSKSGRNYDKFKECNLKIKSANKINSPIIEGNFMVYECKIIYKQDIDLNLMDDCIKQEWYKQKDSKWFVPNDIHTIYHGEIVDFYKNR